MANNPGSVQDKGRELASSVGHAASDVKNKAQDLGAAALHQAKDAASQLAEKGKDLAHAAGQKADDAASAVGGGMKSLAGTVRQRGPHDGFLGSAASTTADALERGGRYLQEEGVTGMAEDLTNLIRRHPIPAMLVGIGLGFLVARLSSRS
jgi:hypothetical protein